MRLEFFDMIDRVEQVDVDRGTIRAVARLPDASPVFEGHFPGFPTLPGVMMLEMINHAAGYILVRRWRATKFVFLGGVKRAKFRRFLRPGTVAAITAHLTHDGSGYAVAEGAVTVDGETVADAEITMVIGDFPDPELRKAFEDMLRRIPVTAPVDA
jgi:3-hydroxyacyl-[acyl-carrier-protein] dehydratase